MTRITSNVGARPLSWADARPWWLARAGDFLELTKPRIVALELVTIVAAYHLASPRGIDLGVLWPTLIGAALVAASAGALNQWLEQASDSRMERTANRPLPAGRLSSRQVVAFGMVTLVAGTAIVVHWIGFLTAAIALATWLIYVAAYTPLKRRSPLNTAVGAVSGALPILIGWTAAGAMVDMRAWALVAAMFLWQFPHFMAIAWLYRDDYARGGQRMLTVVDPTGLRAAAQAVAAALVLVPVSLVPALSPQAGSPALFCWWTLLLGVGQAATAVLFLVERDERSARRLLRASLLYLTCWMGLLVMVAV
ncbi:MAG TPA: heme o synthase [Lacipirellulaceae bacterium]|jgi:protoheme IX farnesyltransferase